MIDSRMLRRLILGLTMTVAVAGCQTMTNPFKAAWTKLTGEGKPLKDQEMRAYRQADSSVSSLGWSDKSREIERSLGVE